MALIKRVRDFHKESKAYHTKPISNPFLYQPTVAAHLYYGKRHYLEREKEKCYDIRFFKKGLFRLTIGEKEYEINGPGFLFFNHYSRIKLETIGEGEHEEVALYIVGPHLDEYHKNIVSNESEIFVEKYDSTFYEECVDEIINIIETGIDREKISILIYQMLLNLVNLNKRTTLSLPVERIKKWIDENYYLKINNALLSQVAGYSEFYFERLFKKEVGLSPIEYVRNVRLEKGLILLTSTSKTITLISQEVGFNDRRSFVTYFKNKMGINPYQYRKEYKEYDEYS